MAKQAHSMTCAVCDCGCGGFEFSMLDSRGKVICTSKIQARDALALSVQIVHAMIYADDGGTDSIGQVEGHA
jgi:hypothetical protein